MNERDRERDRQDNNEADAEQAADVAAALNADMVIDPERERPPEAPSGEDVLPQQDQSGGSP